MYKHILTEYITSTSVCVSTLKTHSNFFTLITECALKIFHSVKGVDNFLTFSTAYLEYYKTILLNHVMKV